MSCEGKVYFEGALPGQANVTYSPRLSAGRQTIGEILQLLRDRCDVVLLLAVWDMWPEASGW